MIFKTSSASPGVAKQSITYRKCKSVDVNIVHDDIAAAFTDFNTQCQDLDTAVKYYNSALCNIADNLAPEKSRVISVRADSPWYTSELSKEKRFRRKLERIFKRTKLIIDKERLD